MSENRQDVRHIYYFEKNERVVVIYYIHITLTKEMYEKTLCPFCIFVEYF